MSGNFLEVAQTSTGIDVGYGKMLLVYDAEQDLGISDLTAAAIQAHITDGTIKGIIHGWNTVAGASVAEVNADQINNRVKKVKSEILADTLTFTDNTINQSVIEKVSGQTLDCILIDDMGFAFGDFSLTPEKVSTMKVNFSAKTSNGLQNDLTNEKTVAITARYLVTKIGFLEANTEVEDIVSKDVLFGKISSITSQVSPTIVFVMDLYNESDNSLVTTFTGDISITAKVNGTSATGSGSFAANQLTVTLTETVQTFDGTTNIVELEVSTPTYYLDEIKFVTGDFT